MKNKAFIANLNELLSEKFNGNKAACARQCGIKPQTLQSWFSGTEPTIGNFAKLARAVNMPISELYYRLCLEKEIVAATEKELGASIEEFARGHLCPEQQEYINDLVNILKTGNKEDREFIKFTIKHFAKKKEKNAKQTFKIT